MHIQIIKLLLDLHFGKTWMMHAGLSALSVYARCEQNTQMGSTDQGALSMLLLCNCLAGKVLPVMVRARAWEKHGE